MLLKNIDGNENITDLVILAKLIGFNDADLRSSGAIVFTKNGKKCVMTQAQFLEKYFAIHS